MIGFFERSFSLFTTGPCRLHHHAAGSVHQLDIGGLHIHHQVLVDLAEFHHRTGRDHVEHQLLRRAGFKPRRASQRFWPHNRRDRNRRDLGNRRTRIAGDSDRGAALLFGIFQSTDDVRCAPGRGQTDHDIISTQINGHEIVCAQLLIVLSPFNRF
ncbi:hypothetical protein D3C78_1319710 [compost metagenome]